MPRPSPFHSMLLLFAGSSLLLPTQSTAIPVSWNNPGGGGWDTAGYWSPASVPTAVDDVKIELNSTTPYIVSGAHGSVQSVDMSASNAQLRVWYNELQVTNAFTLRGGLLHLQGAINSRGHVSTGDGLLVGAAAEVQTTGSTWLSGDITNDGSMSINQTYLDGSGATLINNGTFSSASGGQFNRINHTTINNGVFNADDVDVAGFANNGTLNVTGSRGSLQLTGQDLANQGTINLIADSSTGHSTITRLSGFTGDLINESSGVINTLGDNSRFHNVRVDLDNRGTFNVGINSGWDAGPSGTYSNSGALDLTNDATLTVIGDTFTNEVGGTIKGNGTLNTQSVTFVDNGIFSPGHSFGRINIDGDYLQGADGILELEVGDTGLDQIFITNGTATLNGTLKLIFVDDFAPLQGDLFDLIVGDVIANFTDIQLLNIEAGFQYDLLSGASGLQLSALNDGIPSQAGGGANESVPAPSPLWLIVPLLSALVSRTGYPRKKIAWGELRRETYRMQSLSTPTNDTDNDRLWDGIWGQTPGTQVQTSRSPGF